MRVARSWERLIGYVCAVAGAVEASWICSSRLEIGRGRAARLSNKVCRRGLNTSPLARFTRDSNAWSIPSIARCCQCWKVMLLICIWRQTSAALQRSVQTARTAWALSIALKLCWVLGRGLVVLAGLLFLVEVIGQFLRGLILRVGEFEFEFAFFGAQDDGLPFHAADHIERSAGLAAQRHLQQVLLDTGLDGFAQLALDLEETIGRTQSANALMRALVVVIADPEPNAFARRLKALELRAGEKVLPDRLPEALNFAQRHRVLRAALEVGHAILLQLRLETRSAAPRSVLTAIIREHLPGWFELRDGLPINFDHRLGRRTAEQIRADDETGVIIHEGDDIGVTTTEPEREDVRLPHLIRRGALEEARACHVPFSWRGRW